jgi:hypothetical protein
MRHTLEYIIEMEEKQMVDKIKQHLEEDIKQFKAQLKERKFWVEQKALELDATEVLLASYLKR